LAKSEWKSFFFRVTVIDSLCEAVLCAEYESERAWPSPVKILRAFMESKARMREGDAFITSVSEWLKMGLI
jgi:hypothetical protein